MEKFEKKYRQMIQEDMPDLWGRIEAGLTDRERKGEMEAGPGWQRADRGQMGTEAWEAPEGRKRWSAAGWGRYAAVMAAGLCVLLILPATLFFRSAKSDGRGYNGTAASESATSESGGRYAAEPDNAALEAAGGTPMEAAGGAPMESAALETEDKVSGNAGDGMENRYPEDGAVIGQVRIKVLGIAPMQYHTVYQVTVERDDSGWLPEDGEVSILSEGGAELEEGMEYQVSVLYSEGASVPFRLVEWEEGSGSR